MADTSSVGATAPHFSLIAQFNDSENLKNRLFISGVYRYDASYDTGNSFNQYYIILIYIYIPNR